MIRDPRIGDRARIAFDGAIAACYPTVGTVDMVLPSGRTVFDVPFDAFVATLPDPLKVGDIVVDSAQLADLPDGSVVCRPDQSAVPIGKRRGTWYAGAFPIGAATIGAWSDATVLRVGATL